MLARLGGMIYRTRWLVLFLALLIVAGAAVFGTGLFGSLKSGGFNDPASESSRAQALLDAKLGGATADIVILMSTVYGRGYTIVDKAQSASRSCFSHCLLFDA